MFVQVAFVSCKNIFSRVFGFFGVGKYSKILFYIFLKDGFLSSTSENLHFPLFISLFETERYCSISFEK